MESANLIDGTYDVTYRQQHSALHMNVQCLVLKREGFNSKDNNRMMLQQIAIVSCVSDVRDW